MNHFQNILNKARLEHNEILNLLQTKGEDFQYLREFARNIKNKEIGNISYFRGLVEYSNLCTKDCYYCGIRKSNSNLKRFQMTKDEVLEAVDIAYKKNYGSIVIQSGESKSKKFINAISEILSEIKSTFKDDLKITLSLGEQDFDTYQEWYDLGARKYLLRIETSNRRLFEEIHPNDQFHNFDKRIESLKFLKEIGYHVGTGVMIGLPSQTLSDLANDLMFMRDIDIDMCGMGPYLEHNAAPLSNFENPFSIQERYELTLKMIAILRILMKDINIAATTALQAINETGREEALKSGANVIMPNLTTPDKKSKYKLYENKPCTEDEVDKCINSLEARIELAGDQLGLNKFGDSLHYQRRISKLNRN